MFTCVKILNKNVSPVLFLYLQIRSDMKLFHFFQDILSLSLKRSSGKGRGVRSVSMKHPTSLYGTSPGKKNGHCFNNKDY